MIISRALACLAVILPFSGAPAFADALPVFSNTGPDATAFGEADGYPVGSRQTVNQQRNLVGAYSHYDALMPTRQVRRADAPAPFARAGAELTLTYAYQGGQHDFGDYLDRHPATGLLIARDRDILFEHYRYGRRESDRFTSQSMGKTVLAMLIGIAVDEGKIHSLDDKASVYVPELAGNQLGETTIRALLQMASGIAFNEVYNGRDDVARMGRDLHRAVPPPSGSALAGTPVSGTVAALRQFDRRIAAPGTLWHYASLNSELLGLVLHRATGAPVADYLSTRIWQRIGTEADASWAVDASGQEMTYCCFSAVLRDWARFGVLLANDGAWGEDQVIPRQWMLDATTAAPPDNILAPRRATKFYGYGYQVWILPGPRRQFALLGVHGQTILVDPRAKLVLVHTAVRPQASRDPMAQELLVLWNALVAQEGKQEGK